jgi:leader peptidase (prepilin peptidase)/N-methyltransferase
VSVVGLTEDEAPGAHAGRDGRPVGPGARAAAAVLAIVLIAGTLAWWPATRWAGWTAVALVPLLAAAAVDLVEHRLPNVLVLAAGVPVLVGLVLAAAAGSNAWTGALAGAAVVGLPLLGAHLASPSGLGFGDVKAGAVLGGAVGLVAPILAVVGLIAGLLATAAWALASRRRALPLGPGMVAGAVVVFALGRVAGVEAW